MMNVLIVKPAITGRERKLHKLIAELQRSKNEAVFGGWNDACRPVENEYIKKNGINLLINFNLQGFEHSTLAGGIAYNLLDCKQIHILLDEHPDNEKYFSKRLSISMFFYCLGDEYYNYLIEKYPDIPYLKKIDYWNETQDEGAAKENAQTLHKIISEVAELCHMDYK